jgi:uncharacterized protein with PIN domain
LCAVRCPGCGREYDASSFSFGRTIDCTCGSRVGIEPPPVAGPEGPPRFIADAMLGRLAHWLRILGFDTLFGDRMAPEEIARRAFEEGRVVLTRSRALASKWRLPRAIVLQSEALGEQLRQLEHELALAGKERPFTRCSRCNDLLEPASAESVAATVPERVRRERSRFARCPRCGRVYWEGSHVARIERWLSELRAG